MAIYTKRGDKGKTNLFDTKKKVSKSSLQIEAIGKVDELNSFLGVVISFAHDPILINDLKKTQDDLLTVGSILSGSNLHFYKTKTKRLETQIDNLEKVLPKLKNFIFPGGTIVASLLHFARTLTRSAERNTVTLSEQKKVRSEILVYLNRLSDYLFILARNQNFESKVNEVVWKGKK
ncbi:ATP:cob(I)alamin adenosyltransferase [Candidatus Woesebacteria bacterium RBG_16_34_12]|uniref:Corrinoid adenosyltransferase n=1 Tax=Candidatus Woesebacteria bacterium RBG_16_34_12 TaxID=1802480 RepID=A0A1F7X9R2_9BACT|nr:MAG: ATP:cob(I)alamin adenosyltransferase [Candidatus Woesebacteria bacterium RBG_16_34_12]